MADENNTGVIAGSVVGGFVVLLFAVAAWWWFVHRRPPAATTTELEEMEEGRSSIRSRNEVHNKNDNKKKATQHKGSLYEVADLRGEVEDDPNDDGKEGGYRNVDDTRSNNRPHVAATAATISSRLQNKTAKNNDDNGKNEQERERQQQQMRAAPVEDPHRRLQQFASLIATQKQFPKGKQLQTASPHWLDYHYLSNEPQPRDLP